MKKSGAFSDILARRSVVIAACILLGFSVLCCFFNPFLGLGGFALTLIYLGAVLLTADRYRSRADIAEDPSLINSIAKDFFLKYDFPTVLIDESNEVIWYNSGFNAIGGSTKSLYGKRIDEILTEDFGEQEIALLKDGGTLNRTFGSSVYVVRGYKTASYRKNGCILTFENRDEVRRLENELLMKQSVVAVLVIDNYNEATQYLKDNQREAQTLIGNVLDAWNEELDGIMKEYEKNKYLIVFEEQKLRTVIENDFDILNRIKALEVEGAVIPFTASIGISHGQGGFAEKLEDARAALDLALQRGGDQAVLKNGKTVEKTYGGTFKSAQKRTKIRARVVAEELIGAIRSSGNVIIQGHRSIDHDAIASCLGVAHLALLEGKETHIIINIHDANLKPIFSMMRGHSEYLDLFTDAASAQEYVRSDTLAVVCDVSNPKQFEAPDVVRASRHVAIIDHHRKTAQSDERMAKPEIEYIEPSSSSASELVAEMLEMTLEPGDLSPIEANLLLSGIFLDTNQFTKNTGVRTFGAALYLRGEGADPIEVQELFRSSADDCIRELMFVTDIRIYYDAVAVSKYTGDTVESDKITIAKAANRILGVAPVHAAFVLCRIGGEVRVSARSDGTINVQKILEDALGGGGHFDAAAAQIKDKTLDEAEKIILDACAAYLGKQLP